MNTYNFKVPNADTDSISFCKRDESPFTKEERIKLIDEINSFLPDLIEMEDDGYYDRVAVVKAKNYALLEEGSDDIKYKGSSFKDSKKEPALKEMMLRMVDSLIYGKDNIKGIYEEYIQEIMQIKNISRWSTKKSITENLMEANSTAKTKVLEAIKDKEFRVGDKVFLFNDIDGEVQKIVKNEPVFNKKGEPKMIENRVYRLKEDFKGSYDIKHYLKRAYSTADILKTVIDMEEITNYSLAKNYNNLLDNSK